MRLGSAKSIATAPLKLSHFGAPGGDQGLRGHSWGSSVVKCEAVGFLGIWPGCLPGLSSRSGPRRSLGGIRINPSTPKGIDTVARVTIELDLPPGVAITG